MAAVLSRAKRLQDSFDISLEEFAIAIFWSFGATVKKHSTHSSSFETRRVVNG